MAYFQANQFIERLSTSLRRTHRLLLQQHALWHERVAPLSTRFSIPPVVRKYSTALLV